MAIFSGGLPLIPPLMKALPLADLQEQRPNRGEAKQHPRDTDELLGREHDGQRSFGVVAYYGSSVTSYTPSFARAAQQR